MTADRLKSPNRMQALWFQSVELHDVTELIDRGVSHLAGRASVRVIKCPLFGPNHIWYNPRPSTTILLTVNCICRTAVRFS